MDTINKIKNILDTAKAEYTLHKVPEGTGVSVEDHIKAFGLEFSDGCSTLVFSTNKGFIALLRRDDSRLDSKKLKKAIQVSSLRFATPQELKELTGFEVGMVSPVLVKLPVYVDALVLEKDKVRIGTGDNEFSLEIKVKDLVELTKAKRVEVADIDPFKNYYSSTKELGDKKVLSGINPSSSKGLHLGNYLGAAKNHVEFQSKSDSAYYFIANYHTLNTIFDAKEIEENTVNTYLDYLSFGLEPDLKKVFFYLESGIPEITELNIILNNVVSMAELKKMHAYKDKFQKGIDEDGINHGLFNYPVLMASDILLFDADIVPVGEDQAQHVEITRDIAKHFNAKYGQVLKVPEVYLKKETARVVGTDGEKKMSKSIGNFISIFAPEETIKKQIFTVKTDPGRIHPTDPGDPTKNPIFTYMRLMDFDSNQLTELEDRYSKGTVGDVEIKEKFYNFYLEYFSAARERRANYSKDMDSIYEMIKANNSKVREFAKQKIEVVRKAVGLI